MGIGDLGLGVGKSPFHFPSDVTSEGLHAVSPALSTSEVILRSRKGRGQAGNVEGHVHATTLSDCFVRTSKKMTRND